MKIVTVNIPEAYLDVIKKLVCNDDNPDGLYPSRSELIRCAVREFLIKEIDRADEILKYQEVRTKEASVPIDKNLVRVPYEKLDENGETIKEFKIYKIVKRLEY